RSGLPAFCNRQSVGQALLWKWPYLSPWLGANFSTPGMAIYTILFTPSAVLDLTAMNKFKVLRKAIVSGFALLYPTYRLE
ncbi:hypothetical protein MWR57_02005, partial [Desulfovibrionaceae bacterium CB1MN]|uniref:hypothetical protein n=1 Tax=Hydrosulfovibrio ferrireducens TaxID=2934181 RepID=UPI003ABA98E8